MDLAWQVVPFAAAMLFSPGPNTVMLAASGASHGFRATMPLLLGICVAIPVLIGAVGLGLGALMHANPWIHQALRVAGAAYLLWLAWKIGTARGRPGTPGEPKPINFFEAATFQWVNPKVWTMAAGAVSAFTTIGGDVFGEAASIALIFAAVCVPAALVWTLFGVAIRRWLASERALRAFNGCMAALLVLSLVPMLRG